ncbi:MFS transporter [Actinomadura macrotermitis]|uniref:MFS transporter n=1 Tax=Actinomadura macrotermitis TaxID=2585200 RepID=A0A7K0BVZ5_9ACTN|nr:hypothetical protein [Actinomadura macrotermitis]MQY05350.1 hypothetical protein [Actinomadura macrotermitis]
MGQTGLTASSGWAALVPGFGVALPNVTAAAMAAVPPERSEMAAGAVRQLGCALGIAVLGGVFHASLERSLGHRVPDAAALAWGDPSVPAAFASALTTTTMTASALAVLAAAAAITPAPEPAT